MRRHLRLAEDDKRLFSSLFHGGSNHDADERAVAQAHHMRRINAFEKFRRFLRGHHRGRALDDGVPWPTHGMLKEGLTGLEEAAVETSECVRHGEKRLIATLRPTLERLGEAQKLVLTFAALLPADHVALPWVRVLAAEKFPELAEDAAPGYPDPWQNVVRRLCGLRLLQATAELHEVQIHRLLQEVIRSTLASIGN
jgi:hypothetical protein